MKTELAVRRVAKKGHLNRNSLVAEVILHAVFIMFALICVLPILLIVGISFTDESVLVREGYNFIPAKFSLDAYRYIADNAQSLLNAYGVTILVTVCGTFVSVLIIAFFAYPLSRKDFKYRNGFTFFMFLTMLFNGGMVPWYLVCTRVLHIQNTIFALIVPYLFNSWYCIILRTFFATSLPISLVESAKIDGAGELKTFFRIVIPLSLPGIATVALFQTLTYWNDWWLPLMLTTSPELSNLQFLLYRMLTNIQMLAQISTGGADVGAALNRMPTESTRMALCIVAIGPIIFAYPFFQRYFIQGLTVGAIKG